MIKIKLSPRNEEVYRLIPKAYADFLFNMLLAKSIEEGNLLKELKLHISSAEYLEIKNKISAGKKAEPKKITPKEVIERKKEAPAIKKDETGPISEKAKLFSF